MRSQHSARLPKTLNPPMECCWSISLNWTTMTPQKIRKPNSVTQQLRSDGKRLELVGSGMILDVLEKIARHECRAWDRPGLGRGGVGRAPTPGRLFCCDDMRPFVVGFGVNFVLAGREELR